MTSPVCCEKIQITVIIIKHSVAALFLCPSPPVFHASSWFPCLAQFPSLLLKDRNRKRRNGGEGEAAKGILWEGWVYSGSWARLSCSSLDVAAASQTPIIQWIVALKPSHDSLSPFQLCCVASPFDETINRKEGCSVCGCAFVCVQDRGYIETQGCQTRAKTIRATLQTTNDGLGKGGNYLTQSQCNSKS